MPALPTVTTAFLTRITNSLKNGTDFGNDLEGASANYLRSQDLATALELLQDAFNSTASLTAAGGSTTTLVDGTKAAGTLTFSDVGNDAEVITIGSKVYTLQASLTAGDGHVKIGGTPTATADNLVAAITGGAGSGTTYGAGTTAHTTVTASASTGVVTVTARSTGFAGNAVVTTTDSIEADWDAATLEGGADAFPVGGMVGQRVVFTGNTTPALAGAEAVVLSNTGTTLTFTSALPGSVAAGDTYTIEGAVFDTAINALREGKSFGEAPVGSTYANALVAKGAICKFLEGLGTQASQTLTFSGQPSNTNTVVIGTKTYTFQTVLTNSDGNVLIGATAAASLNNLVAAINLGTGSGTTYAAATTVHPTCVAEATSATVLTVKARNAGTAGDAIVTTETCTNVAFGGATLAGGANAGSVPERTLSWAGMECGSGSTASVIVTNMDNLAIDQFRGKKVTISGDTAKITGNDEDTLFLETALAGGAPSATTAISITEPEDDVDSVKFSVYAGGQPGDNKQLAYLIETVQAAIAGYANPI